jgi:outer membrane protein OmpA-like peptidoglycan-associated protein
MTNFVSRVRRIGGAVGAAALLAGCGFSGVGPPQGGATTEPQVTQDVPASALLMVTNGASAAPALSSLAAATARSNEDLRIMTTGTTARMVIAADSPTPVTIGLAAEPAAPGRGATAYQRAQYARKQKAWLATRTKEIAVEAARTDGQLSAWVGGLSIAEKVRQLGDPPAQQGSLAAESAVAASAQTELAEGSGNAFGSRKVVVLYCTSLGGGLPAGELTGDDVIVVTSYLPSAADASAAQAELLEAGAAQAAVTGPSVTSGQLAALVSAGLAGGVARDDRVSKPVLFGNGSYTLSEAAVSTLAQLLPELKEPGATAVINGFASTPGTAEGNYLLSYQRASAAAGWYEAHGVAASSLIIVGHGAADPVGPGDSAANRRVLVVVQKAGG